jgi:hypothetical protein
MHGHSLKTDSVIGWGAYLHNIWAHHLDPPLMERCRIWWPRQQRQPELESVSARYVLFGWLFPRAGSVDIIVAAFVSEGEILRSFPSLDTFQVSHGSA